jgi:hypothetical protein
VALELPGWVVIAFNYAGLPWPGIDEDELRAWATSVRTFAGDVTGNSARTHQVVAGLAESQQSSFTSTLAARWEQHNQLIADLHEPLNVFADALDVAADVVVAQKLVVIGAAVAFATEFAATQIGAFLTLGADEAALPEEIISTREIIDFAIGELKGALIGELVNGAVQEVSDQVSSFVGNLLTGGLQVVTEYQSLKISYSALRDAAQSIRGQADETQETGDTAYAENANRDIEDPGEAEATADGWAEVVQAVKQALLDLARSLFKSLPQVILRAQEDATENLSDAATILENADSAAGRAAPHDSGVGPSPEATPGATPADGGPGPEVPDDEVRAESGGGGQGGNEEPPTGGPAEPGPEEPFDPAFRKGALGSDYQAGVFDPKGLFQDKERVIADRLQEEGWRVDAREADDTVENLKNPDAMVRKSASDPGSITEFKRMDSPNNNALKREINDASDQAGIDGDVVIDGRLVGTTREDAERAYRRALGQQGKFVSERVHVILGDGNIVTFEKEQL